MTKSVFLKLLSPAIFALLLLLQTAAAQAPTPSPRQQTFERLQSVTQLAIPEWRFDEGDPLYAESTSFDDSGWKTYKIGEEWTSGPAWFRGRVRIPEAFTGYAIQGSTLRFRLRISGENPVHLAVYFNGNKAAEGNDLDPVLLTTSAQPGTETLIAIRADVPGGRTTFSAAQLELNATADRPDPRIFYQEALAADAMIMGTAQGAEHAQRLDAALQSLNWNSLEHGDQRGFDQSLSAAREKMRAISPWLKTFSIQATGNSHIDMAWLWPSTETVEVVRNTFTTVLRLMREYPDFTFTHSSAVTYSWMQEKYPKMFQEIEQRVKEGRWEPVGGMWVEPDLNMPDGESLVRQLLVGTRYFKSTFGKDIRIGWNPDSFGYNWQLPQI